ncbi:MAG: GntR family transcriptional regulator [Candidatus Marinimicrobia bacterium]|nr:GntR family transcriptional regulator [Candidatus Neomarinimicrobiota bacterium]
MNQIDDTSVVPKYFQLKEILVKKIMAGEWKSGEKIPAERELVTNYSCSLITINKAVNKLVEEGYVFRERGRGTFVNPKNLWGRAREPIVLKLVGVVVHNVSNQFGRKIVQGVEDYLHSRGYSLILGNHYNDFEKAMGYASLLLKKHVDGIIFSPFAGKNSDEMNIKIVKKLIHRDIPYILIDKYLNGIDCSYVVSDNFNSSYKLIKNLIKSGHEKIAVFTGLECSSINERLEGYRKALEDNNIQFDYSLVLQCDEREISSGNIDMITEFLENSTSFSAIFTLNAIIGKAVILALEKLGNKVPEDIKVASYDNLTLPHLPADIFTKVIQPSYKMGEKSAEILIQMIEKGERENKNFVMKSEIINGKDKQINIS